MNDDAAMLEALLIGYFHAASPSDGFARNLESRLVAAYSESHPTLRYPRRSAIRLRMAVVGILIALGIGLAIIGPDRVWAAVQQFWQRYIPGIGLVDETNTRILAEPVVHTEAGVTFVVQEFVATAKDTSMLMVIRGLSEIGVFAPESVRVLSPDGRRIRMYTATFGRIWPACGSVDCQEPDEEPLDYRLGYVFDPLPPDVHSAMVTVNLAGLVPGAEWSDRLELEIPLTRLAEADDTPFNQLIYSPDASLSIGDMNLTVTNVVQAEDRTVLDVTWSMPRPEAVAQAAGVTLVDDQGRRYTSLPRTVDLDENLAVIATESLGSRRYLINERWVFEALAVDTRTLTLEIEGMRPRADAGGSFEFDLPAHPRDGDLVPIDETLNVAGGVLRLVSVRFVQGAVVIAPRNETPTSLDDQLLIEVDFDVVEQPPDGMYEDIMLEAGWSAPSWIYPDPVYSESAGIRVLRLVYDPDRIWSEHVRIHFGEVTVYHEGPWTLSWDVPGR